MCSAPRAPSRLSYEGLGADGVYGVLGLLRRELVSCVAMSGQAAVLTIDRITVVEAER
jgi:hypothetical protein